MPQITLDGTADDLGWVIAVMAFPANKELRKRYFAVHKAIQSTSDHGSTAVVQMHAQALDILVNAPSYADIQARYRDATKEGMVAGDVLGTLYLMSRLGLPEPSINKAVFVAQEW